MFSGNIMQDIFKIQRFIQYTGLAVEIETENWLQIN